MSLLSKLFRKKKWRCVICNDFWGDLAVVLEVDSPANYAIDDYVDVIYKILKYRGCGKYAIVGPYPITCYRCGHNHDGVLVTSDGMYLTYCKHCMAMGSSYDYIMQDEKGYYIQHYRENASGRWTSAGITRIKLLKTFSDYELVWK